MHSTSDRDVTISTIFDYEEKVIEFRTQDANWISTLYQRVADTKSLVQLQLLELVKVLSGFFSLDGAMRRRIQCPFIHPK